MAKAATKTRPQSGRDRGRQLTHVEPGDDDTAAEAYNFLWEELGFSGEPGDGVFYCSTIPSGGRVVGSNFGKERASVPPSPTERSRVRIGASLWVDIDTDRELSPQAAAQLRKMAKFLDAKADAVLEQGRELKSRLRRGRAARREA